MKFLKKRSSTIIFLLISLLYALSNIFYWKINTPIIPKCIDGIHFYDIFKEGLLYYNAPLMTWIMKAIFCIFGKQYFDLQIIILNYFFFIIALYFIYKIGVELKNKETGNIAMILFALTPVVYGMSRQYGHQDWHVMIAMTINVYCLIKLNFFNDRKWSILYGITVGLGLLVKDEFLPYFFTPWLYVAIKSLIEKTDLKKIINISLTIIIGILIAGCHYFRTDIINKTLHEPIIETSPIFSFDSLRVTTIGLWEELLSPPIFLLFIIAVLWFIVSYRKNLKNILLLWLIIPWAIITFMPHFKSSDYEIALIPAMILIISVFVSNLKNLKIKNIILFFTYFICLLQFINFSYGNINLKIFNSYIKFNNHRIYYYNNDFIYRKKYNFDLTIDLVNKLKKYSNYSFLIYYYDDTLLQKDGIVSFANINDINIFKNWDINIHDIYKTDIILKIGKQKNLEDVSKEEYNILSLNKKKENSIISQHFDNRLSVDNEIENHFYLLDSFYLKDIKDPEYLVELYAKNKDF